MKYLINIIAIILIVVLSLFIINLPNTSFGKNIRYGLEKYVVEPVKKFFRISQHNIEVVSNPPRKRPLSTIQREALLEQYLPNVFGKFSRQDWDKFWDLIYEPVDVKQGEYVIKHYLTEDEIKNILIDNFLIFSFFKDKEWRIFFDIIYGKIGR